ALSRAVLPLPMSGLNLAQQEAVNYLHGPCLVLAGAGSGKTRVITHKIARLIQAGLESKRIAAITFTNKAAAEMRERAKALIGREAKDLVICTFHALRSEEHTSELQSRSDLVCRLLLEKKKITNS